MNRSLEFRVGLLTILALALFVWLITKVEDVQPFRHVYGVGVTFQDVQRLVVGDPVRLNGLPIGKVRSMALRGVHVLIWLEVEQSYKILRKARITIGTAGFFGANYIKIQQPLTTDRDGAQFLAPGEIVTGAEEAGIDTLMDEAHTIFTSARKTFDALRDIVGDPEFRTNMKETSSNLKLTTAKAHTLLDRLDSKLDGIAQNLHKLTENLNGTVEENRATLHRSLDDLQQLTSDLRATVAENRDDFNKLIQNSGKFAEDLAAKGETVKKLKDALDELKRLLHDYGARGPIGSEVAAAARNVTTATADLKTVAEKAKDFFTDPETEKKVEQVVGDVHDLSKESKDLGAELDKVKFDLRSNTLYNVDAESLRSDLLGVASYNDRYFAYLGQEWIDHGPGGLNTVQLGTRMWGDFIVRSGTILDKWGMGVDAELFDKKGLLTLERFRSRDPIYRVIGRWRYNDKLNVMVRAENLEQPNPQTLVGVEHHF